MHELVCNGTTLSYVDAGKGAPPLVLVHDVGCDLSSFLPQMEHFCIGHRVAAIDLRGHGRSGGAADECTIAGLADDLALVCYELGLYAPALIGHGIGGLVCIEAAARHRDLASSVVAIGSPLLLSAKARNVAESFLRFGAELSEPAFRAALRVLLRNLLQGALVSRYADGVLWSTLRVGREVALSAWRDALEWNAIAVVSSLEVPLLYIDTGSGVTDVARLERLCPTLRTASLGSSNYFAHLQFPERVYSVIEAFLRDVAPVCPG